MFAAEVIQCLEVKGAALLVKDGFKHLTFINQEPRLTFVSRDITHNVAVGAARHRMVGIKEVLAVKTQGGETGNQQRKAQRVREFGDLLTERLRNDAVLANLVIFDIFTLDADRVFPGLVGDGVAVLRQLRELALTDPLFDGR
ncbi:Uncharacterised protein [Klebsiella pneumoniae]|nr:Uncharacterised protein [Klebsiella pneumoniae]